MVVSFALFSDQNKNKATKSASTTGIKRPHQPDVISSTIDNVTAAQEVTRLEALCEARTQSLNLVKKQLRQRSQGFEAMAVLLKYLTEEVCSI